MEYSPPPLFKQGASARAKVIVFSLIAVALLVVDARFQTLRTVRQVVGAALYPLQVAAMVPRDIAYKVGGYFIALSDVEKENEALRRQRVADSQLLQQAVQYANENAQLRKLLGVTERVPAKSVAAEILYDARDAFSRKIVLDRGIRHGVAPGQPVIDDVGIVGQVTRVFPYTSEVTLLTDKDQAIPVQVLRNGLRSVAYGRGQAGVLDLRFMPVNADVQKGDTLVTSGLDGVYPPGLSVATVTQVESRPGDSFARIVCQPTAGIGRHRQLLILLPQQTIPPREAPAEPPSKKTRAAAKAAADKAAAEKPAADKADAAANKGAAPGAVKPAEAPAVKAIADKPAEKAGAKAMEKAADKSTDKPTDKTSGKTPDKTSGKASEKKAAGKPPEKTSAAAGTHGAHPTHGAAKRHAPHPAPAAPKEETR
ncbi:MAG: rod shape-determining protein MreC [Burkholderiaceae bacterium]